MAKIAPFQPYRYSEKAGRLNDLVTQPYDKITPAMRSRYLALSPYNIVRVILGEGRDSDSSTDNVYTRAHDYLKDWMTQGILVRDAEPSLFAYFQEFCVPGSGEKLTRKGFIGLGVVEDYSQEVVYRHEQTLTGPKKDRLELLRHTRAHFGQLFMVYPDPAGEIDRLLDESASGTATASVVDEYGAQHRLWKISDPAKIRRIQELMADKKLLIADGHHRYETALAFRNENPATPEAAWVMMTFVNMHSPGLKILATHRLVSGLVFDKRAFLKRAGEFMRVEEAGSFEELKKALESESRAENIIGAAIDNKYYVFRTSASEDSLDVRVLHEVLLGKTLGVGEEAVREEKNIRYVRDLETAVEQARSGAAQIAFLLRPSSIEQVARISFAGGMMPQKSTDFYPKLLSGLTIYKF